MERVKLEVRSREGRGGKDARAVRERGDIPGVIYKKGVPDATAISVNARALRHVVAGPGGMHAVIDLSIDGGKTARTAIIKELQLDPVRDTVLHIDLHEIPLDEKISTVVPVHLEGEPHGVAMGGALSQPTHEVHISVLPTAVPEALVADISALEIGGSMRLADIPVPEGVEFLDDPDSTVIASVSAPISEAELETEADVEAAAAAAEEAEIAEAAAQEAGEEAPTEE
jgi:large subunit ribosomal protein L25